MAKKFKLISNFEGYSTKPDKTNTNIRHLVSGSQNVLINDAEKVSTRGGYTVYGAENSATTPIESSFEWSNHLGNEWALRGYDDELEFYAGTIDGVEFNAWTRLKDGWSSVAFQFTTWWDTSEAIDLLLFVAQDSNIYDWSGGVTSLASATSNSLTKNGSDTWGAAGFLTAGTRKVVINGTEYTYTGGEGTTTLTGVTPDPSGEAADSLVFQAVRTNSNQPASGLTNDIIETLNNQVYVGDVTSREVYVSKNTSFTDYTFSSPRVPGEGALLTLDNAVIGFVPQEDDMYVTAGKDDWYRTNFTLSDDNTKEILTIKKLKSATQQAAQSQGMIAKIKNAIVFISNEPTLDQLGRIENIDTPQAIPISDPIKPDFDNETFTNAHIKFWRNKIYIATPTNDKLYIYDVQKGFWQPPQILPVRRLSIIGGELYGHSSRVPETYKLFDGTNDNGNPFTAKATFAYRNFGTRANLKNFSEYFTEGYIAQNTKITLILRYELDGSEQELEYDINGQDSALIFQSLADESLGSNPLGDVPLGGSGENTDALPKFRIINIVPRSDFYEIQAEYKIDATDYQFEILSHGPAVALSKQQPTSIKK